MLEVKRCDELQRQIKIAEDAVKESELYVPFAPREMPPPLPRDLYDLEAKLEKVEEELVQVKSSTNELRSNFLQINNLKQVLVKVQMMFNEVLLSSISSERR